MSAAQIPNLNTLRRGGGRGRSRGGRGDNASSGSSSHGGHHTYGLGKDRVVQGTDTDASVSRMSAVSLGYLNDPFAQFMTPPGVTATRRLPIINRGTYVRTVAIDRLVALFLESAAQKKQIISLGAGSDTRVFRLLQSSPSLSLSSDPPPSASNFVYHEIDFSVNTSAKIRAIRSSPLLLKTLGIDRPDDVTVSEAGDALHSATYHIHPLDLRQLAGEGLVQRPETPSAGSQGRLTSESDDASSTPTLLRDIDPTLPTLLLSECCLVYLSPNEAAGVVDYFTRKLLPDAPLGMILYEPIRPDDAFGRTMVSNLAARGIQLQTLHRYASLDAQRKRLAEHGFSGGQAAADVDFLWSRWVTESEKERVAELEMLDEMEEWRLLAQHYCVAWGWREGRQVDAGQVFDGWRAVEEQDQQDG